MKLDKDNIKTVLFSLLNTKIKENKQIYELRLEEEIQAIIQQNKFKNINELIENNKQIDSNENGLIFSFLLELSKVDPVQKCIPHNYEGTPDIPDVDVDISSAEQHIAEQFLKTVYGDDNVMHVATFIAESGKNVIRDVARVLDLDLGNVNQICKFAAESGNFDEIWEQIQSNMKTSRDFPLKSWFDDVKVEIETVASKLEGCIRAIGGHSAGCAIIPKDTILPLPIIKIRDEIRTAFSEGQGTRILSDLGFVKYDFLGLTTLAIIKDTIQLIKQNGREASLDSINMEDSLLYEEFAKGNTDFIFQFSSEQMKEILKGVKPKNVLDLAACNALYRPGSIKFVDAFIENQPMYTCKEQEEILKDTRGIIIYQEQISEIFKRIGGFSPTEAEGVRKILKLITTAKPDKDSQKKWKKVVKRFGENCKEKDLTEEQINELLEEIKEHAGYSFNKSHSLSYSLLAVATMYFKKYYPTYFHIAVLKNHADNESKANLAIKALRNLGYKIEIGDINSCSYDFVIDENNKQIFYALSAIKNIRKDQLQSLLEGRPINSLEHYFNVAKEQKVHKKTSELLIKGGFLDCLETRDKQIELFIKHYKIKKIVKENYERAKFQLEKELFGFYLSEHPLEGMAERFEKMNVYLPSNHPGKALKNCNLAFVINDFTIKKSKKGSKFAKIQGEDFSKTINIFCWVPAMLTDSNIQKGDIVVAGVEYSKFGFVFKKLLYKF